MKRRDRPSRTNPYPFAGMEDYRGHNIICTGLAVAYALYAPEVFKAETLLAPAQEEKSAASSALSQFGDWRPWLEFPYHPVQMLNGFWLL